MYEQCFEQLDEEDKERLQPIHAPVYGFGGEIIHPRGVITFPVTLSDGVRSRTEEVEFLVLPATSKHDIILGREAIGDFNAHPSTAHGAVGVPTRTGVAIIHVKRHYFTTEISRPSKVPKQAQKIETEKWVLNKEFPDQTITIGPAISEIVRTFLKQLLTKNVDIFAWCPADMTGVPRSIVEHKLRVNPMFTPIVQKKRKMGPEQTKAMNEQVQDLLHAGIIRESKYQTWVANPVIVPKSNGTWRMCAGFKANPDKVQAIARMPSPSSLKEVQTLNGRLVALNRFLANHAAKSHPFVSTLRNCLKKTHFKWTTEAEKAFLEVKKCLMELPTLTTPYAGESLTLYLSSSDIAIGAVLLTDRKNVQTPIYYVSRTLSDPETRYSMLEKLVLALVYAARRLHRHFQGHPINVLTGYKLKNVLSKPELSGRLEKWAIELGEHSIEYKPRPAIKGQVLADFVKEVPHSEGSGAGLRLVNPEGHEFTYAIKFDFKSTNNEAEYKAFLAGLRIVKKLGVKHLEARVDSMLIAGQINGTYEAKNDVKASYMSQARVLIRQFSSFNIFHIKRSENKSADALSKLASTNFEHFAKDIRVEVLDHPSVPQNQVLVIQTGVESWMSPIIAYLSSGALPAGKAEARKIKHKALNYQLTDDILYRRSFLGPLLRCVDAEDANYLIREIHEGFAGYMRGPRMTVAKIMNAGYYWPGMHLDAVQEIRKMNLDLLEERRELALIREHNYKRQLQKYYNLQVQTCEFDAGDFVFRNNEASGQEPLGKLSPTWEGPYKIKQVLSKGAYKLEKLDGTEIPRTWNTA
ncbi:uncharacterized protein LOC143541697 [Bidens hawaiensis]|uniref:uncharacterized protein LOC143541697 n=1 Tax=Bidens hawaiensis TaxID=980011 RepID=UPI004049E884